MIIKSFNINRFGIYNNQRVEGLSDGLNVFLGHNEAGKSTCLSFFRAMFFGYKRSGRSDALDYSKATGSSAGGGIQLVTGQGRKLYLARRPGKHGGELTITNEKGRRLDEEVWRNLLSGCTLDLYDKVFTFDLDDISSLSSIKGDQVSRALHGAAFGTGFKSPSEVLAELDKEQRELFAPAAKNPPINKILSRLDDLRSELLFAGSELTLHGKLSEENEEIARELEELDKRLAGMKRDLGRRQSLVDAAELWSRFTSLESELADKVAPEGTFAPGGQERLDELLKQKAEFESVLQARTQQAEQLGREVREFSPSETLLSLAPSIYELYNNRTSFTKSLKELPALMATARFLSDEREKLLQELGKGWDLQKVFDFDLSIAVRGEVTRLKEQLGKTRQNKEIQDEKLEQAGLELEKARQAEEEFRSARKENFVPIMGPVPDASMYTSARRAVLEDLSFRVEAGRKQLAETTARISQLDLDQREWTEERKLLEEQENRIKGNLLPEDVVHMLDNVASSYKENAKLEQVLQERQTELEVSVTANRGRFRLANTIMGDKRRLVPLLVCLFLAWLALSGPIAAGGSGAGGVFDALTADKSGLVLAILALWGGLFWVNSGAATFSLVRPGRTADEQEMIRVTRQAADLSAKRQNALVQARDTLQRAAPEMDDASILPDLFKETREEEEAGMAALEVFVGRQKENRLKLQLITEQAERARAKVALADQRDKENKAARDRLISDLDDLNKKWREATTSYGINPECRTDIVLQIFDKSAHVFELAASVRDAEDQCRLVDKRCHNAEDEWRAWLARKGFDDALSPEFVEQSFILMEKIQSRKSEVVDLNNRVMEGQKELDRFRERLVDVLSTNEPESAKRFAALDDEELPKQLELLHSNLEEARRNQARVHDLSKDVINLEGSITEYKARLESASRSVEEILSAGQAANAEDYRVRQARFMAHQTVSQQREQAFAQLKQLSAGRSPLTGEHIWKDVDEFMAELKAGQTIKFAEEARRLQEDIQRDEELRETRLTRLGEVRASLAEVNEGRKGVELKEEQAALLDELSVLSRRWSVIQIAKNIILRSMQVFEQERQDLVIRRAGKFFNSLTGGNYEGLHLDLGKKDFKAMALSGRGGVLDSEAALSRGTREQLYLSLRLAYIQQHNQSKESLPVIMDDILVNFDPRRTEQTATIFRDFSENNQCLFFTCHPHVAEMMRGIAPKASFYKIENGQISALPA